MATSIPYEIWIEIYLYAFGINRTFHLGLDTRQRALDSSGVPSYHPNQPKDFELYWTKDRIELYKNLRRVNRAHNIYLSTFIHTNITVHVFDGFRCLLDFTYMFEDVEHSKIRTLAVNASWLGWWWSYDALTAVAKKRYPKVQTLRIVEPRWQSWRSFRQIITPLRKIRGVILKFDKRRFRSPEIQAVIPKIKRTMADQKRPFKETKESVREDKLESIRWSLQRRSLVSRERKRSLRSHRDKVIVDNLTVTQLQRIPL